MIISKVPIGYKVFGYKYFGYVYTLPIGMKGIDLLFDMDWCISMRHVFGINIFRNIKYRCMGIDSCDCIIYYKFIGDRVHVLIHGVH